MGTTLLGGNIPILHTIGGRAYPVRHYPIAIRLRTREEYAILCIALNPQSGDFSGAILEVPFKALLHGVLSVVCRSSLGGIRQGIREVKEGAILIKRTFPDSEFFGRSLVLLWFFLGLLPERERRVQRKEILIIVLYNKRIAKKTMRLFMYEL